MTYDASNRKSIRRAEKAAKLAEANRVAYVRTIMASLGGREWMHSILLKCNVFHTPFVRGASDLTSFNCGRQNVGLELFHDVVTNCPNEYILMMQEQATKEEANDRRDSDDRSTADSTADIPSDDPTGTVEDDGRNDQGSVELREYIARTGSIYGQAR